MKKPVKYCWQLPLCNLLFLFIVITFFASCNISKKISRNEARILLADSSIGTGFTGISIFEPATNQYWFNYNATHFFMPASNTKLFTLFAALKYLGDSLIAAKYLEQNDTLFIQPTADPSFLHPNFVQQPLLELMKNSSKKIAIVTVGDIACYGKGWTVDDFDQGFMAEKSMLPVYGNTVWVNPIKVLGITRNGSYQILPTFFEDRFNVKKNNGNYRKRYENVFFLDSSSSIKKIPFITNEFSTQSAILSNMLQKPVFKMSTSNKNYKVLKSQTVDSILIPMMHNSDNFFAEQLLMMVGSQFLGCNSTEQTIKKILETDLINIPQIPVWADASGLSRYNLFTPQSFIYILNKMQQEFGLGRLQNILPTGGIGTLKNYYIRDSNFVFAKTGSLSNQLALSGILITKKNKLLLFSVINNNYKGSTSSARLAVEYFIQAIRNRY